jgi:hypothetical protein
MAQQTAVEFLIKAFQGAYGDKVINVVSVQVEQAKQMEKQQIFDAFKEGVSDGFDGWGDTYKEKYYNETYGSKGSDEFKTNLDRLPFPELVEEIAKYYEKVPIIEATSSQTEISDEEIEKESNRINGVYSIAFEEGAKWYREQLKKKI